MEPISGKHLKSNAYLKEPPREGYRPNRKINSNQEKHIPKKDNSFISKLYIYPSTGLFHKMIKNL